MTGSRPERMLAEVCRYLLSASPGLILEGQRPASALLVSLPLDLARRHLTASSDQKTELKRDCRTSCRAGRVNTET